MKPDFSFLLPPNTHYKDVYDIGKFDLTWKMITFNSVFLFLACIGFFFFEPGGFFPALYAWLLSVGFNFSLWYFKKYKLIGFLYSLHGCVFLSYALNAFDHLVHALEFFWMLVLTLYTFFAAA